MNNFDERYQSPVSQAEPAQKTQLTKEEWRYAGKMFVLMSFGAALPCAVWPIWWWRRLMAESALPAKTTGDRTEVLVLMSMRPFGAVVALFGICMALFFVVRRRTKAGLSPPNHGLFWPMFVSVPLSAPLFGLVMLGAGTAFVWLANGGVSSFLLKLVWRERIVAITHVGFTIGTVTALFYALLGAALARGAAWAYKWPILAGIATWFVTVLSMELIAYPVKFVLSRVGLAPHF